MAGDLASQASKVASGSENPYKDYDFCHHCKQLKNKYLLVACKYSSRSAKNMQQGIEYQPYPYEPTSYSVKNVKIYNGDL